VVAKLSTHKLEGKRVLKPSINLQGLRVATKDETREGAAEEPRPYLINEQKRRDPNTKFGELEIKLGSIKGGRREIGSLEEDVKSVRELIDSLPGGDDRETKRDLRHYVTDMLIQVFDQEFNENNVSFRNAWNRFGGALPARLLARHNHPKLALVYDYFTAHGADIDAIDVEQVLTFVQAVGAVRKNQKVDKQTLKKIADTAPMTLEESDTKKTKGREIFYQRLLAREGYDDAKPITPINKWNQEAREVAYLALLGMREKEITVNPAEFWEKQLLPAVEARLEGMRGKFSIIPKGADKWSWDEEKMFFDDNHSGAKGFSDKEFRPSLLISPEFRDFRESDNGIARFLQKMGRDGHWEGKRRLDVAFWSKVMGWGPTIDGETNRIYQELDRSNINDSNIGYYTGAEAWEMWRQDKELATAYDAIFSYQKHDYTNDGTIYYKPLDLDKVVPALQKSGISDQKIMEAIMLSQVYCADMVYNTSSKNRIFTTQMAVSYYRRAQTTDDQGNPIDLLSHGFGLTDTIANKMYLLDARNDRITYAAYNDDRREWNPKKHPDQVKTMWETAHFPIVIAGKGIFGARFGVPGPDYWLNPNKVYPDDIVLAGNAGDYMSYDNNRSHSNQQKDKDNNIVIFNPKSKLAAENRFYLHQHALFKLLESLLDRQATAEKHGSSILGWNDNQVFKYGRTIETTTIKNDVQKLVKYFEKYAEIDSEVNDQIIQRILKRVLPNKMAWGSMLSLQDGRTMEMMRDRADLRHGLEYEVKSKEAWNKLGKIWGKLQHDRMLSDIDLAPAEVIAITEDLHHRFRENQIWMQMGPLLEFATRCTLSRMAKTFPTQEQLEQLLHQAQIMHKEEMDFVKNIHSPHNPERDKLITEWEMEFGLIPGKETIIGQDLLQNGLFIHSMTESHLRLIADGLQASADHAVEAWIDKLMDVRVLGWQHVRELIWKSQAFMWNLLGTYAQAGKSLEEWQQLDVVWEKDAVTGNFKTEPVEVNRIAIQDITDKEKAEFFYEMGHDTTINPGLVRIYTELQIPTKRVNSKAKAGDSERTFLVFQSVDHRRRFYERRTRLTLNLFYGREEGSKVRLDKYFDKEGELAGDTGLIRQISNLYERVLAVNRVNAYYKAENFYVQAWTSGGNLLEAREKTALLLEELKTQEELRPLDAEIVEAALKLGWADVLKPVPALLANWLAIKKLSEIPVIGEIFKLPILNLIGAQSVVSAIPTTILIWSWISRGSLEVFRHALANQFVKLGVSNPDFAAALGWTGVIIPTLVIAGWVAYAVGGAIKFAKWWRVKERALNQDKNKTHKKLKSPLDTFSRLN